MLSIEWAGGLSDLKRWLVDHVFFCDGFFHSTPVLTKSVAEMAFSLDCILNVAFVALYHINEVGRKMSR